MMTLSYCGQDDFTCADGHCISMDKRCNRKEDCQDSSDERDCNIIKAFEGYNKMFLPLPAENQDKFTLNISLTIRNIVEIDEINGKFGVNIRIIQSWLNPQFQYLNLQRHEDQNILSENDKEKMWIPYTVFANVKNLGKIMRTHRRDFLKITPDSKFEFKRGSRYEFMNSRIFSGSENALKFEREFDTEWNCDFNLGWFPFDSQVCFLKFFHEEADIELKPIAVEFTGSKQLSQHYFKAVKICEHKIDKKQGVVVEIHIGRPLFGSILTIFMPTIILVILSQVIQVFAMDHIEMVIGVHLTLLLVLATM